MDRGALAELERSLGRWRRVVYCLVFVGTVAALVIGPDPRRAGMAVVFFLVSINAVFPGGMTVRGLLLIDLSVSVAVWWLYGPVSGAAFIALGVVAVGPFVVGTRATRVVVFAALLTVPIEVALHFVAGEVPLPLFHPPGPVPTSEFLTGEAIKAALLIGIGILMVSIAGMVRKGQRALAADLDRERELNSLKDRFVATVSHELRTPLTTLKGFTQTLLDDDVSPTERREFLTIMADQADELHALIEDVITFGQMSAGGVTVTPARVDLHELTAAVLLELGARAGDVSNRVPPGTMILADPPRIHQVLRNLVDNALKYGEPPIVVTASNHDALVRCSVLDAGRGIESSDLERAFVPYARLVDDPTMSAPGLGLGLPIARELVAAHSGEIRQVADGYMSGFEFTVPFAA
ncbi:MAG: HAMP domain-containing sensor histidine kinase [Acidimicrobiia bacterium]